MNRIHSKVWNRERGQIVVASEFAKGDSAGVVQGAGAVCRKLLAVALAPLLALAGSIAFAQDMDLGPGGSLTIGDVVVDGGGVAIGGAVVLDDSGLSITGGPSVTLAGINAGNQVITNVLDGVAATDAVNVGQLNAVGDVASAAQSAAAQNATGIADNAAAIATNAADILANANQIDAVRATAEAGWNISAEGGAAANVAPDATVDFSGDGNIEVARTGTDLQFNLADAIEVDSVSVGGMTLDVDGIDAAGKKITNLANGDISATSSDAVTGQQVHELFFEGGTAFGVRYFRANSIADDAEAVGAEAIAIGPNTIAEGASSFAAGDGAATTETGEAAIAVGQGARAGGELAGGEAAIAIGRGSVSGGNSAAALGDGAHAGGGNATAVGAGASANGGSAVALGDGAVAAAQNNISIGTAAGQGSGQVLPGDQSHNIAVGNASGQNVAGQFNTALGTGAGSGVEGDDNVAFGRGAGTGIDGDDNVSIGRSANAGATSNRAVAIGFGAGAETEGIAIGFNSSAGTTGVALGRQATALGTGTAVGPNAYADSNFVALGLNSWATQDDVSGDSAFTNRPFGGSAVSVGSSQPGNILTRRIVNVEDGANDTDAVNVRQLRQAVSGIDLSDIDFADGVIANLQDQINENMLHYVSINDGGVDKGNKDNSGADAAAVDSIAIGPDATTKNRDSIAIGHHAGAEGDSAVVLGHNIKGLGANSTTIGSSQSEARDESGIAIGTHVVSRDENSIVIGRDSYTNRQASGPSVENSIVIGTRSSSTAVEGIVIGKDSVVNAPRGIAQGSAAHATAGDAMAFGTQARASGTSSQASGTGARASGTNSIASGTGAAGYANDGIAMGTAAVSGFSDPANQEPRRNMGGIAIGQSTLADNYHALALGVQARATDESATAIGDGAAASAEDALAVGSDATATGQNASAFGPGSNAASLDSLAVGSAASATGVNASAVGAGATAMGLNALAVGAGAQAEAQDASAVGRGALALNPNSVALGAGSVTGNPVPTSSGTVNQITYGGFAGTSPQSVVSVGSAGSERQITNVAAGRIGASSTDAINGSQLFATQTVIGNVAHSTADVLGGNADVAADGTITMTDVGGTGEHTVHGAIEYAAQGWNVRANDEATGANVAPGGSVGFSNGDGNIDIARTGTDLEFNLSDELTVGTSISVGGTVINGTSVSTTNLTATGDVVLGDDFTVNNGGVYYDGPVTDGNHVANKTYVDGEIDTLASTPLTFAGDSGSFERVLGETVNVTGGAATPADLTDGNIGVVATGANTLEVKLNKDLDLGADGSVAIGDTTVHGDGLRIVGGPSVTAAGIDAGGQPITNVTATPISRGSTDAVNAGQLFISLESISNSIGGNTVFHADGSITTSDIGNTGHDNIHDAIGAVNTAANAGWNLTDADDNEVNIGPNGMVTFVGDDNITVTQAGTDQDGVIEVALSRDLDVDSVTAGDSVLDGDGLLVDDGSASTAIGAGAVSVTGGAGTILIDGNAGTIGGLANTTFDPDNFTSGQAATEDQLAQVSDVAHAGWNVSVDGEGAVADNNVGPGGVVDFSNDDGNIDIARTGTDLVFNLSDELEVGTSITVGDTVIDSSGVAVGSDVRLGNTGLVIDGGPSVTIDGIDAGGDVISNVATGVAGTDAVNVDQLHDEIDANRTRYYSVNDNGVAGGNYDNDGATGLNALAAGVDASAAGAGATAIGYGAQAAGDLSVAMGQDAGVAQVGSGTVAVGAAAGSNAQGDVNTALGVAAGAGVVGDGNLALGAFAGVFTEGDNNVAIGAQAGFGTVADDTVAIGRQSTAGTDGSIALGADSAVTAENSVAIGAGSIADGATLGDDAYSPTGDLADISGATAAGEVSFGSAGSERRITNVAAGSAPTDAVNVSQLNALAGSPLTFAGDAGTGVDRVLGETVNLVGGATDPATLTEGNIGVVADGSDTLEIKLNKDIDLTAGGSVAIGGTGLDNEGLEIDDGTGNVTTVAAGGTTVTDGTATTSIGAGVVSVAGGINTIVIDGDAGTIGGLANRTFDPNATYTGGVAATQEQLSQVNNDLTSAGLDFVGDDGQAVHRDLGEQLSITGGATGALSEGNIGITANAAGDGLVVELADNIELTEDGSLAIGDGTDGSTLDADGLAVVEGGNGTAIGAGTVSVTDATGTTTIGGNVVTVGGANPIVVSGDTGTIGGLQNQTIGYPGFADGSGRAATEEQLDLVNQTANAGWNLSGSGADQVNIGPDGSVDFQGDQNIGVAQTGNDQDGVIEITLNRDLDVDSVTAGDTFIDTTGVAIGADVHLGSTGLVINNGPSVTVAGIDAGGLAITNVAPGEISATSQDAINGSQLHGMGDSIVTVIGGNATLNPDGTITTSDIGGTGHDNIDDAIRAANDAANAGWTATDAAGNDANIGPNGSVNFTGDGNINVAQTGSDNAGEVQVTLNRDLDVDSITAGNTVIDTDGVRVGDDVRLGGTGLVIEGGPSVTTDGIDAGGSTITNVAAGVNDTDAVNVGQLNQVAGDVSDLGDRMDVVEGDVADLQAGAAGPFQVSQEAPIVPPSPTGANSAAGGSGADASGDNATALGNQAVASGANSTAVGQGAQATHDNSVALGQGSATTVGAQSGYDAAYVGTSSSAGEVNVGNRTVSGVAPGVAGTDAVNVNQLQAGVNHAVVTANAYTDQRFNQVQNDVWHLHGRVDELERDINAGVATAMALRQAPYVAGATTYYAGFGSYKGEGALGVSLRRTADNGRWSLEGGFSANRDGAGGYIGVSGVLGGK